MSTEELPKGWVNAAIGQLVGHDGVFVDGDWVESKDQDPEGDVRLIQLADVGDGEFRDRSARFLTTAQAHELGCTFLKGSSGKRVGESDGECGLKAYGYWVFGVS